VKRGKDPLAVGPTGIAANAVRYVRGGRRLGTGEGKRGLDVFDLRAHRRLGTKVISIDSGRTKEPGAERDEWRQWLTVGERFNPADAACFTIDFAAWLDSLPPRKRKVAELLALGHETGAAACILGVTPAAVSISRSWLEASWRAFQGQPARQDVSDGRRPRRQRRRTGHGTRRQRDGRYETHFVAAVS
jgi:hypothetical protein